MQLKKLMLGYLLSFALALSTSAQYAILYSDCDYRGQKVMLVPGRYSLSRTSIGPYALSSIKVNPGIKIVLYEDSEPGQGTRKMRYTSDVSCLPGDWNDKTASVIIEADNSSYSNYSTNANNNNNYNHYNGGSNTYQSYSRTDHITLFSECYFGGRSQPLGEGDFNKDQLGIGSDQLSSIDIPSGWSITLYKDKDFSGNTRTFTRSVNCLPGDWIKQTTSVRISRGGGYQHETDVTVFEDCNYSGRSAHMSPGLHNVKNVGIRNDAISSMRIPKGYRVTVYRDEDGRGMSREYRSDVDCIGTDWDNQITSLRISNSNGYYGEDRGYSSYDHYQSQGYSGYTYSGGGNQGITVYENSWFGGQHRTFSPGAYNLSGDFDLKISSIRVDQGYMVELYTDFDQRGQRLTLTSTSGNLNIFHYNDKVRSMRIIRN